MQKEQLVFRKKLIRSDGLLMLLVMLVIVAFTSFLAYLENSLALMTRSLQFVMFFLMIGMGYFIITRQLTSFRYVLTDDAFSVYRCMGKAQKLSEHLKLEQILFIAPYLSAGGVRGREHALCGGRKQDGFVVAHDRDGRRQWLIVSLNDSMLQALMQAKRISFDKAIK